MNEFNEANADTLVSFESISQISAFDRFYADTENQSFPIYNFPASIEGLQAAIAKRKSYPVNRDLLTQILTQQYAQIPVHGKEDLIDSFKDENTYAVTCAHQPNIFTGPVFFIYKLLSTIKLAELCKIKFPGHTFIPVLYLGGEDHDLAECNHIHLFGKRIEWNTKQTGAVGRMKCNDLTETKDELFQILGDSTNAKIIKAAISGSYSLGRTINQATTHFLHQMLPDFSFLVFNPDDAAIKRHFIPSIKTDLLDGISKPMVEAGQNELAQFGINAQAYVRDINFFYLQANSRTRIVKKGGEYGVLDTDIHWDATSIATEIDTHPERFSPNVIMRPILQEQILPSIAFVGGGGEIAYWSDRKQLFAAYKTFFPVLVRRDSFTLIDATIRKKMNKLQLTFNDLLSDADALKMRYLKSHTEQTLNLNDERKQINEIAKIIIDKAMAIDPTLKGFAGAETNQFNKILGQIENRLIKSLKEKNEVALQQVINIQLKLFPEHNLQERHENFMNWFIKMGETLFATIYKSCDPLNIKMKVLDI